MKMPTNPRSATGWAFALLFGGLLVWTMVTELDYGVHAEGKIANRYSNIPVQHNTMARVTEVRVVEGQQVKAGDVLATLDDVDALAEAARAEAQRLGLTLQLNALLTELAGRGELRKPVLKLDVLPADMVARAHAEAVRALRQRLAAHQAQLAQFGNEIAAAQAQVKNLRDNLAQLEEQKAILTRQVAAMGPLAEDRLVARNTVDDLRMRLADLQRMQSLSVGQMASQQALIEQAQTKRSIYLADRDREMRSRLSEIEPQAKAAEQAVEAAATRLRAQVIRATGDGQVVNLKVKVAGEVVTPGTVLMELVPLKRHYYVEARIMPAEVENVVADMPAEITFVTLPAKSTPYVDGKLATVASNSTMNEKTGEEFYITTVEFTGNVVEQIGLEPKLGMPVQVLLKGGRRSVLSYVVEPFSALLRKAMKES